jgi:hypothetical protein
MALNTASKRASSVGLLSSFILAPPLPDGVIDQGDRQHIIGSYSGILAVEAEVTLARLSAISIPLGPIEKTIAWQGNLLPISVVTATPISAPSGNKGVVFKISGGVATIYIWDAATSAWVTIT